MNGIKYLKAITYHFQRIKSLSNLRFVIELSLLAVISQIAIQTIRVLFFSSGENMRSNIELFDNRNLLILFVNIVLISPVFETFLGQWFSIRVASFSTRNHGELIILSALFFSSLHVNAGLHVALGIFPVSCIFSWSFLMKREESLRKAYWITTLIHILHNLIVFIIHFSAQVIG
jgi:hypothetical protein